MRKMNSLRFQARTIKCSSYTKYKKQAFNKDFKMASWDSVLKSSDVNSAWNGFKSTFLDICDRQAPLLTKTVLGYQNPWMTSATSNFMKPRDFYLRKAKKSGRDEDWDSYRSHRNQVTAAIRNVKSDYNQNLQEDYIIFFSRERERRVERRVKKMPLTAEFGGTSYRRLL